MDNNKIETILRTEVQHAKNREQKLNHDLIDAAMAKSPTGGNAKPLVWNWIGDHLEIRTDMEFDSHYLNRNHHTTWIALGCLCESITIAASQQSFDAIISISEKKPHAFIKFKPLVPFGPKLGSLAALLSRATYRGRFQRSGPPVAALLSENQIAGTGLHVAASDAIMPAFRKFLLLADTYLWRQKKATVSFVKEIRFFDPEFEKRGIRSQDLGVAMMDQILLYILSFAPRLLSFIATMPVLNFNFIRASKSNLENAHFVLITADGYDAANLVLAGREAMRAWLQLEDMGYHVQPYSTASITLVDAATGHLPDDTLAAFRKAFSVEGPKVMASQFKLRPKENAVWLLRVGRK